MKKIGPNKNKLMIIIIAASMFALLIAGIVVFAVIDPLSMAQTRSSGSFTNQVISTRDEGRSFNASRANGYYSFFASLTREQLDRFIVESPGITAGEMTLILRQDNVEHIIQIGADGIGEHVNMIGFTPGRLEMRLEFNRAENVHVNFNWR